MFSAKFVKTTIHIPPLFSLVCWMGGDVRGWSFTLYLSSSFPPRRCPDFPQSESCFGCLAD